MSDQLFPPAFAHQMQKTLGNSFEAFEQSHRTPSPTSIRTNPKKAFNAIAGGKVPWTAYGFYLDQRPVFTLDPAFHAGAYYVQEASSMFLEQAFLQCVNKNEPLRVLDLCAAPGGKSTHLASLLNDESLLVSNEVIRTRAGILAENLRKWGPNNVVVTQNDPADFQKLPGYFDLIVVDAPCSGEGLFRKDPEAMNEWSPENVALCASRQKRILTDVWPALKQGGILVYCTCTYNAQEDEDNLQWLAQHQDAEFLPITTHAAWGITEIKTPNAIGYRCYPHLVKGEGFFLSAIRKNTPQEEVKIKGSKNTFSPPSKKILEQIQLWMQPSNPKTYIQRDDTLQCFPANRLEDVQLLAKNLYIISAGTFLATVKHEKLIPEHALAMCTEINKQHFTTLALDHEQALQYLRKETLNLPSSHKGFALITYNHLPLGWVNVLPNRLNNLYPSEWRIRMQ